MSKTLAAKTYQVPRTTLLYRVTNPGHHSRPGPSTILNKEEKDKLEEWINVCSRKGFPKRKDDVISSVANYLKTKNRDSSFKNGAKWFKLFLQRHPNISFRIPKAVPAASAALCENQVRGWFKEIEDHL